MSSSVFLLVLLSAIFHAGWNFAARKVSGNLMTVWLALWLGCGLLIPALIVVIIREGIQDLLQFPAFACVIATGLIHAIYFRLVAAMYRCGEISIVYPIARGSGIALTAVLAILVLKEKVTTLGVSGIGLISAGIVVLGATGNKKGDNAGGVISALGLGATIVAYSLIDKVGVGYIHPVKYIWLQFLIAAMVLTPFLTGRYHNALGRELRQSVGYAVIIGGGSIGTYLMVLFAFTMGPVGYIVAVRELSVVFGALAGIFFLKEQCTALKVVTIIFIVVGNILIRLG